MTETSLSTTALGTLGNRLPRSFYARPVLVVARQCIGQILVRRSAEGETAGRIVEAEAYRGPRDLAAHSARGRTRRTEAMFGPPGHAYLFLLYGRSWAINLVTGQENQPHAVLIRALEPVRGLDLMARRRGRPAHSRELCNGPGKLTQALAIDGRDYGRDLCGDELYLQAGWHGKIACSARINVAYAGAWADKPWRFYEVGNRWVSVPPRT
ncbi:MAG TPA: DNA-3-methyladenine glycosylase [Candidatus Binataceae bacterium]|nr:DNA-3-methyladenine glycosylase [Candidatus Binataceae bacterium]